MKIIIATTNAHKLGEIRAILGDSAEVGDLSVIPDAPIVDETGTTFEANARLKAESISRLTGGWVLADDSGLEVDVLGGEPGVHSARFAGMGASDAENRLLLRKRLSGKPQPWTGRFRCVIAVAGGGRTRAVFEGSCEGRLLEQERGSGGFGYDPLFVPEGHDRSFAELPGETKNRLSHRGRALEKFREWWISEGKASGPMERF